MPTNIRTRSNQRSSVSFPYYHLESCIEIVGAVHAVGGGECEWNQLAAHLGQAPNGGSFRQKMISARTYGLLEYADGRVILAETGHQCIDDVTSKSGFVAAFLNVPLFKLMFDKLDGQKMPPPKAIEQQMKDLGVAPKQAAKTRQLFLRSARFAGFFEISPDRMTKPTAFLMPETVDSSSEGEDASTPSFSPSNALIQALLDQMPPQKEEEWNKEECFVWFQALLMSVRMIYKKSLGDLQEIEIRMRPRNDARTHPEGGVV